MKKNLPFLLFIAALAIFPFLLSYRRKNQENNGQGEQLLFTRDVDELFRAIVDPEKSLSFNIDPMPIHAIAETLQYLTE